MPPLQHNKPSTRGSLVTRTRNVQQPSPGEGYCISLPCSNPAPHGRVLHPPCSNHIACACARRGACCTEPLARGCLTVRTTIRSVCMRQERRQQRAVSVARKRSQAHGHRAPRVAVLLCLSARRICSSTRFRIKVFLVRHSLASKTAGAAGGGKQGGAGARIQGGAARAPAGGAVARDARWRKGGSCRPRVHPSRRPRECRGSAACAGQGPDPAAPPPRCQELGRAQARTAGRGHATQRGSGTQGPREGPALLAHAGSECRIREGLLLEKKTFSSDPSHRR